MGNPSISCEYDSMSMFGLMDEQRVVACQLWRLLMRLKHQFKLLVGSNLGFVMVKESFMWEASAWFELGRMEVSIVMAEDEREIAHDDRKR